MNRPFLYISAQLKKGRKEGDSNPRYENSHGSLANCWFQPLTHPSFDGLYPIRQALFLNAVQRYKNILICPRLFHSFFRNILFFASNIFKRYLTMNFVLYRNEKQGVLFSTIYPCFCLYHLLIVIE